MGRLPWFAFFRRARILRLFVFFDMAEETVVHAITLAPMERLGIVGLPNAGKSALFNALTGGNALVASHPFATTERTTRKAFPAIVWDPIYDDDVCDKLRSAQHSII